MKEKKALFSQRLGAFFIDMIIVSVFATLISVVIPASEATDKLYDQQNEIMENYVNGTMEIDEYVNNMLDISYDISKQTSATTIISIVIGILYFVVYPTYQQGQTLGKKLLKIKVKKTDDSELTMNDLLFRSFLNQSILVNLICVCLVLLASKKVYIPVSNILSMMWYVIVIISAFMIAFSKRKQGIHDKIVKTEVVMIDTVKEELPCEN